MMYKIDEKLVIDIRETNDVVGCAKIKSLLSHEFANELIEIRSNSIKINIKAFKHVLIVCFGRFLQGTVLGGESAVRFGLVFNKFDFDFLFKSWLVLIRDAIFCFSLRAVAIAACYGWQLAGLVHSVVYPGV